MKTIDYTGQTLDNRYRILKLLGAGGMGAVYLGEHVVIGKKVAIKFLHAEFVGDTEVVKRFYREAQAAAAIHHKNIIDVADVGVSAANEPYLVMEYLEGESLAAMLDRTGPISLSAACAILEPVLAALQAAHDKGIVHRDLKPENIFLAHEPDGAPTIKLIDFGISKFTSSGHSKMTGTGMMLGTPAYMSPEQIRGKREVDHRTDIYAMGVVLYQMLTGKLPFPEAFYNALVYSVMTDDPVPPKVAYADFPEQVEALVLRILSKSPDDRPPTAAALLEEIKKLSDFQTRFTDLTRYSSGVTIRGFAGGALGSSIVKDGGASASDVLSEMAEKSTPADWSKTNVQRSQNRVGMWVTAVVGLAAAAALVGVFTAKRGDKTTAAAVVPLTEPATSQLPLATPSVQEPMNDVKIPVQTAAQDTVRLTVKGVPEGAVISYNSMRMLRSAFLVSKSEVATELTVTADGYKRFSLGVVPDRDQEIFVELEPSGSGEKSKSKSSHSASKSATEGAAANLKSDHTSNGKAKEGKPKLVKSGKTKLTESFED